MPATDSIPPLLEVALGVVTDACEDGSVPRESNGVDDEVDVLLDRARHGGRNVESEGNEPDVRDTTEDDLEDPHGVRNDILRDVVEDANVVP